MTTIAWRDGIVACDSAITGQNGKLVSLAPKLVPVQMWKGITYLVGCTGDIGYVSVLSEWVRRRFSPHFFPAQAQMDDDLPPPEIHEATAYVFGPKGQLCCVGEHRAIYDLDQRWRPSYEAAGTGGALATGAMAVGATAVEAVAAAIVHDPSSCLPIHSYELAKLHLGEDAYHSVLREHSLIKGTI